MPRIVVMQEHCILYWTAEPERGRKRERERGEKKREEVRERRERKERGEREKSIYPYCKYTILTVRVGGLIAGYIATISCNSAAIVPKTITIIKEVILMFRAIYQMSAITLGPNQATLLFSC